MDPVQVHVYAVQATGQFIPKSLPAKAAPYSAAEVATFLTKLIPRSLPILRRLQLGPKNGSTLFMTTKLPLDAHDEDAGVKARGINEMTPGSVWTMAFIDRGGWPATEVWPFCSLELVHGAAPHETAPQEAELHPDSILLLFAADICSLATSQLLAILSHVEITSPQQDKGPIERIQAGEGSSCILAGNVHTTLAALLSQAGLVVRASVPYGKYLFSAAANPQALSIAPAGSSVGLPDGLVWSVMSSDTDYADVMAVNPIVRSPKTLARLPNVAVRELAVKDGRREGKAVAFAFAAGDGSVRTLHVDPEHRRKGLAKAVVRRLLDTGVFKPPCEGPLAADQEVRAAVEGNSPLAFCGIAEGNVSSIRTFEAIGATWRWDVYWLSLDLDRLASIA